MVSANAQLYRAGSRAGNRMANYAHSMKRFSIQQNAKYVANKGNYYYGEKKRKPQVATSDGVYDIPLARSEHKDHSSWAKHFVILGCGIGGSSINPSGKLSHSSFDMNLICMNVLLSVNLGSFVDTGEVSSSNASSYQIGALIPVITFDKSEYMLGQKGKIFIAPLIGFIKSDDTIYDGNYMHENVPYHNCSWWISKNRETDTSCTEYGGAVMVKYGCGYVLGKVTNKSWGISIGLCM